MKKIAVIPARLAATRFPNKLIQDLGGKPVIVQTYLATKKTELFDEVYVVTDSQEIFSLIENYGGKAIMSQKEHSCGSDRIAEAIENMDVDIIVNVQGDEPFIETDSLRKILTVFENDTLNQIDLVSLMTPLHNSEDIQNPNNVKVITDINGFYAFRKKALLDFYNLPMRALEACEKFEQLRYLEYGKRIKMIETDKQNIGIDTLEDLEKARAIWK